MHKHSVRTQGHQMTHNTPYEQERWVFFVENLQCLQHPSRHPVCLPPILPRLRTLEIRIVLGNLPCPIISTKYAPLRSVTMPFRPSILGSFPSSFLNT